MNEEELHKLFHRIELDKSSNSCGFEFADGFDCTFDNIATCYDDRLKLYELVKQLQNNWNELKRFIEDDIIECKAIISTILPEFEKLMPRNSGKTLLTNEYNKHQTIIKSFEVMLSKMQELDQGRGDD